MQVITIHVHTNAQYQFIFIIKLLDCLRGLDYAMKLKWFDYKKFNLTEYQHYEKVENGDLNWIVPNKFVAFSSPYDKPIDKYGVTHLYLFRIEYLHQQTMFQFLKSLELQWSSD